MPQLTGVQLVQEIRKRGITGKIAVLSANLSPDIRAAYQGMGGRVVMDKPFNVDELRFVVNQHSAKPHSNSRFWEQRPIGERNVQSRDSATVRK